MDGSTASLYAIPIVVTLALAAWLILVAYAAAHPQWKRQAPAADISDPAAMADRLPSSTGSSALADTAAAAPIRDLAPASASKDDAPDQHAGLAAAA
jgi:hypothetical protein